MLVLSRKINQSILIADNITVTVTRITATRYGSPSRHRTRCRFSARNYSSTGQAVEHGETRTRRRRRSE